ncbi:putative membrane protein YccC [Arthrobacter pascens]|nr:putative membrane protein YccC [Arthrobacter pascens]
MMRQVRALHRLEPADNDHLAALRVALSVAVPSLVLLIAGREDLIIYAVFGALTGMYGRSEPHQLRLRHQSQAALVLLSGVGVGIFLSVNHLHSWWLVGVEALLAGAGSVFADKVRLKPNGPFFGILALGACASVATDVPWYTALLIAAASAAFSLAVGFAGWVRARAWQPGAGRDVVSLRGPAGRLAAIHAARYVLAVGAAGTLGVLSGSGHPHWAMAAAAVPSREPTCQAASAAVSTALLGRFSGWLSPPSFFFPACGCRPNSLPTTTLLCWPSWSSFSSSPPNCS